MHQAIFTTHFLCFNNLFYDAIWLRVRLYDYVVTKKEREIINRNKRFELVIESLQVDDDMEQLYTKYRQSMSYQMSQNLTDLLYAGEFDSCYNTLAFKVYDETKLIAVGILDMGALSSAGISCFYDPAYKKYSLGKYLMFQKMAYCRQEGLAYFYPGYVVPGYKAFDYKMDVGTPTLEYFNMITQNWIHAERIAEYATPLNSMYRKLHQLQAYLQENGTCNFHFYRYFDASLDPIYSGLGLLDFPIMIKVIDANNVKHDECKVVVYDVRDDRFHIMLCSSLYTVIPYNPQEMVFTADLLQVQHVIISSSQMNIIKRVLFTD